MGIDLYGWIEARRPWTEELENWIGVAPLHELGARNYYLFAMLFGVHGSPDDRKPLAAGRGLPATISQRARAEYDTAIARWPNEIFASSWITWAEITAIDWYTPVGELVLAKSIDPEQYGPAPGFWTRRHAAAEFEGPFPPGFMGRGGDLRPGLEWEVNGVAYRVIEGQRYDLLGEDWKLIFSLLEKLADRYGADAVRLTVWFSV